MFHCLPAVTCSSRDRYVQRCGLGIPAGDYIYELLLLFLLTTVARADTVPPQASGSRRAAESETATDCSVPSVFSVSVPPAVANEQEYGISALAFAAVAAAVLLRVGLCRRAWVELPPIDERVKDSDVVESVGDTVSALHSLAPSWRNRFLVCATLCDAFALAAPGFGPEVRNAATPRCPGKQLWMEACMVARLDLARRVGF